MADLALACAMIPPAARPEWSLAMSCTEVTTYLSETSLRSSACTATAIRALIKQLIGAEDGKKPLSDSQLSEILGQQGIVVARRTVAKYRESLNIPPVNLRKTL